MTPVTFLGADPSVYGLTYVPLDFPFQPTEHAVLVYTHVMYELALDAEEARARGDREHAAEMSDLGAGTLGIDDWKRMLATARRERGQA